ncbi:MAG: hypothetical protein QNI99_06930 [Woeseiaceae bacterium]|nr:hypothetical protein [Woeseiaceae bacterium]
MNVRRFSAPGKVVLSGEYAVLRGAPAVAMAVDRRAVVTVEEGAAETVCVGLEGRTDTRLIDCVLDVQGQERPDARLTLDTAAFSDGPDKLGIGSSAALAVALTTALAPKGSDVEQSLAAAQRAHREFQKGRGSGVDVAASSAGGIIVYRMQDASTQSIAWPAGLHYALFWTGKSASTTERVARFDASSEHPATNSLCAAAEELADAWRRGSADDVLSEYVPYMDALQHFDSAHGLGIFDGGHAELAIADPDFIYKPCGAGGGDVGIALSGDADRLREFAARAAEQGARKLDVSLDPRGAGEERSGG